MARRPRPVKVHWSLKADDDLHRLWMFNADFDVDRADLVEARLKREAAYLAAHPSFGRPVGKTGSRDWTLVKLPYVIRYRLDEDRDALSIERIWHSRENREGE